MIQSHLALCLLFWPSLPALAPGFGSIGGSADEQLLRAAHLKSDGPALLEYLRKLTDYATHPKKIQGLVNQLGDDSFDVREKASESLISLGRVAVPLLREARQNPDPEIAHRAAQCVQRIDQGSAASLPAAATRLLVLRKPVGATETLLAYVPFAENENTVEAIRDALAVLAKVEGPE
jgi:hypothetical protein